MRVDGNAGVNPDELAVDDAAAEAWRTGGHAEVNADAPAAEEAAAAAIATIRRPMAWRWGEEGAEEE